MAEERIVERSDGVNSERVTERGAPTTTIVEKRGGGMGLLAVVLLIGIAVLAYFLFTQGSSEARKDDAVAGAASAVERTADKVGDAVSGN